MWKVQRSLSACMWAPGGAVAGRACLGRRRRRRLIVTMETATEVDDSDSDYYPSDGGRSIETYTAKRNGKAPLRRSRRTGGKTGKRVAGK
jgi:hypothetical protein